MRPSLVAEAVAKCVQVKQPFFIWGQPGIGKSAIVHQVAKTLGMEIVDLRLSTLDSPDLRGYPHIIDGRMCFATPDFLPTDLNSTGILFLDELNAGRPDVQAATYQLVFDRQIGRYKLPPGWAIAAAGNRETDQGVTYTMPAPLANRFVHLYQEVSFPDWRGWANKEHIKVEITNFMSFRPDLLMQPDYDKSAFPTPRSWTAASKVIDGTQSREVERALVAGAVGDGAAAELAAFLKIYRELPNPDSVILAPEKATVPKDLATLYALCGALANRANETNFAQVIKFARRLKPEFQTLLVRDAVSRKPALADTQELTQWTIDNAGILS